MNVLAMPISGGCFPHQLCIIRKLMKLGYKPNIMLGSSGGNISAYLALASKWDPHSLDRIVRGLNSNMFVKSWLPSIVDFIPSWTAGLFMGSMYKTVKDFSLVYNNYFSPNDIKDIEIWIGAVNKDTGNLCLFCNRSREESMIQGRYFEKHLASSEPLRYLNGDREKICIASIASSSIPMILPYQTIDGKDYIDGGIKYASPLTPLQQEITKLPKDGEPLHIVYISGYNLDVEIKPESANTNVFKSGLEATNYVARGLVVHDRLTAYGMLLPYGEVNHMMVEDEDIEKVMSLRSECKATLIEFYPESRDMIDFANFEGIEALNLMNESIKDISAQIWWVGDKDLFC